MRSAAAILCLTLWNCSRPAAAPKPSFRDVAAESGLRFQHFTGATGKYYLPEIMGPGVALIDYDGDGDLDVFFVQGAMLDSGGSPRFPLPAGSRAGNRLFRNMLKETGKMRFEDVTERAGLAFTGYGMGATVGDYNNDGHPDLYVTNFGPNVLYRNNGNGTFTDVTKKAGVEDGAWSTSASWIDYDKDGRPDLYVDHYLDFTVQGNKECSDATGKRDYCAPSAYKPVRDRLYHNIGHGKFEDVTSAAGIGAAIGAGLGVLTADFDEDGRPDIYVTDDGSANLLWMNNGDGTFRETALLSGAAYAADGIARAGMGVTAGDFDASGHESIFVTNLTREGATLYRNDGHANFTDLTARFGLSQPTFAGTGFGVEWFDYDNDGRPDLFIANGAVTIVESLRGEAYPYHQQNVLLHNEGERFRDTSAEAGPAFKLSEVGRGVAFGDLDNNGTVDLLIANNNGPARLLLNEGPPRGHWLEVDVRPGARVTVLRPGQAPLVKHAHTDGSYLSSGDPRVHFGLGDATEVTVQVAWPGGLREEWNGIRADQLVTLREGAGTKR